MLHPRVMESHHSYHSDTPGVTPTFNLNSEFAIPWDCIGSPTDDVRWLTVVQNENTGHVIGVFPPQVWDMLNATAQNFYDFGGFDLTGEDLADGTLDDFLLIFEPMLERRRRLLLGLTTLSSRSVMLRTTTGTGEGARTS